MSFTRNTFIPLLIVLLLQATLSAHGQYGISFDIKKPKEFENRVLRSEKEQKKFTVTRRFIQNTVTHYNYFFNANNKLNEVLEKAKSNFKDDYSQLIPFYNYSLDVTAADSLQLDSISSKAQTGIVLHDLRSDWADNLYLLWGASYYLQKEFDSARLMFQFINYAFAEKEKDGYYKVIGSARDGNNAFTVSTPEKNSVIRSAFSEPPSRNDAFIWQIRNYLAQDRFIEAGSLIQILQNDPKFPPRLKNDLEEVQAYSFYKQKMWDSTATHLQLALSNATNKQEQARWEYLLGQLYERTGKFEESQEYYAKAINHTTDPVMDIYARLSSIRVNKDGGENYIDQNINTLLKMAHRDKYVDYRDIIYYMAAQMELERNNKDAALALLLRSNRYPSPISNQSQRNRVFLQIAELSFDKHLYRQSSNFYDSIQLDDPALKNTAVISSRKSILHRLADYMDVQERQDSLQRIAALPEDERKDYVKKLTRQLRKQQGLKDESSGAVATVLPDKQPVSLFADNSKKGEWYFYNANSKQKGTADFKAKWGTRSNSDNWRRAAAQTAAIRNQPAPGNDQRQLSPEELAVQGQPTEITYDALYAKLPLTPELIKKSNDSIQEAMFQMGLIYRNELEDCLASNEIFESIQKRFPEFLKMDEVLFHLYYCYNKTNRSAEAEAVKKIMTTRYPESNNTAIVTTGKNPNEQGPRTEATKDYEHIYDLFIEGNFEEAIALKKTADSMYSSNYWNPQLMYIEAIYNIKQRNDSAAKASLTNMMAKFNGTPLGDKATVMLDVLNRRDQIEEELRNLVIARPGEDTTTRYRPVTAPVTNVTTPPVQQDTANSVPPPVISKDTARTAPPVQLPPVVTIPKKVDSAVIKPVQPPPPPASFAFTPETPHYVGIMLTKVDPIFVSEARNAFARHNRDIYYNKQMQAELIEIDADNKLLLISPFKNAQEATDYVDRTRPRTASEIIPWLKGGKYTFTIITDRNLELLRLNKDIEKYNQFLNQHLPGKFQ